LDAGFDVSPASYAGKSFSVSSQDLNPQGLAFNTDGTSMFIVAKNNDRVYQYTLSTAFDVSTASYASKSFSVASQETSPTALAFNTDGTSMFIVGISLANVHQYTLADSYPLTLPSVVGSPSATAIGDRVTYTFVTKDGGTTIDLIAEDIIQ
jgi:sugar lactone lactonase YvrE